VSIADNQGSPLGRGLRHPEPPKSIRVLVCDDHAVVRAGLRAPPAAADGIEVVAEAAGGEEAVRNSGSWTRPPLPREAAG
jgi:hypothetical protein